MQTNVQINDLRITLNGKCCVVQICALSHGPLRSRHHGATQRPPSQIDISNGHAKDLHLHQCCCFVIGQTQMQNTFSTERCRRAEPPRGMLCVGAPLPPPRTNGEGNMWALMFLFRLSLSNRTGETCLAPVPNGSCQQM